MPYEIRIGNKSHSLDNKQLAATYINQAVRDWESQQFLEIWIRKVLPKKK